jgi:glycosyltransferase involved in cell wall biosynthesis
MEKNKITVVIPVFNSKNTIIRTLNSVLNQTYKPFEIILVDDGSTDNSIELAINHDKNLKIINKKNGGVSSARNLGIKNSNSEWIAFLDSDDTWNELFLEKINNLINIYPSSVICATSYQLEYSDGSIKKPVLKEEAFESNIGILENYFKTCYFSDPPVWTSATCVNKKAIISVGCFSEKIDSGEDLIVWAKLSVLGNIAYDKNILATYNQTTFERFNYIPKRPDYVAIELNQLTKSTINENEKKFLKKYIGKWHKMRCVLYLLSIKPYYAIPEIYFSQKYLKFNIKYIIYLMLILFPRKLRYKILIK